MKWFENLFKEEEKIVEKELRQPIPELEVPEQEPEQEVEPEPKIETFDVIATGSYTFDVIEKGESNMMLGRGFHSPTHLVKFSYKLDVEFMGVKLKVDSYFTLAPEFKDRIRSFYYYGEEEAYEYLAKLLEDKEVIMENIRRDVVSEIRNYVKEKNITKLKETLKKNNSFDLNMTFKVEKTDSFTIK
jgi:hypothetical protein